MEKTKDIFKDRPYDNAIPTKPAQVQIGIINISSGNTAIFIT
jgi:hypothetical protein